MKKLTSVLPQYLIGRLTGVKKPKHNVGPVQVFFLFFKHVDNIE